MNENSLSLLGQLRLMETRGYSAYEVAQQNGFTGTEEEWLASLVGPQGEQGPEGKSAYDVAVENGYQGTVEDWVNDFLTPDGYYTKEETDEKITDEIEFIFNAQKDYNDSFYIETSDIEPEYNKKYFIKTDDDFYSNGYLINDHLTEFKENVTYYECPEFSNLSLAGECSIIKAFGKTIMLDTGGIHRSEPIRKYLQEHNVTKIDYLILSHYHYDHCTNLANMVNYLDFSECKCYFPNVAPVRTGDQHQTIISNFINNTGVEVIYPNELDFIEIGELKITFYNCGQVAFNEIQELYGEETQKINDYCMVVLFNYRNTNVLYSGDIEYIAQERLYNKGFFNNMKIDLYKYHHHGVNAINNCYIPFLTEMSPKQVVILSTSTDVSGDRQILNLKPTDCAYLNDISYISTGQEVVLKKRKQQEFQLKNKTLYGNSFDINKYCHILTIKVGSYYKNYHMLFALNDVQGLNYNCLFRISFKVLNLTTELEQVKIENLSSTGSHKIINDIYVGLKDNTFNLYLKKTFNYNTPKISLLSRETYSDMFKLEYGHDDLTEEEFTSKYGDNYYKGSFSNLLTLSEYFANYNDNGNNSLRWYKTGNIVEITGVIKNLSTINAGTDTLICELPDEIQPADGDRLYIQQSNLSKHWCAHIVWKSSLNKYVLNFTRYGYDGSLVDCAAGAFLCVSIIYTTGR